MEIVESKFIEIFCPVDSFNKLFINELQTHQITVGTRKRIKPGSLNESEIMTIVIYFHLMKHRDFIHYYLSRDYLLMRSEFLRASLNSNALTAFT